MKSTPIDPIDNLYLREVRPSEHVLSAIHADMAEGSGRRALGTRRRSWGRTRIFRAMVSLLVLVTILYVMSPKALRVVPEWLLPAGIVFGGCSAALLYFGGIPGNMRIISHGPRRALVYVVPPLLVLGLGWSAQHFALFEEFLSSTGLAAAASCLTHSLLVGVLSTLALIGIWRRSDPFSPALTGALLGVLGGLLGTLSTHLGCGNTEGVHLSLAHGAVAIVLSGLGSFAGRKWLSP